MAGTLAFNTTLGYRAQPSDVNWVYAVSRPLIAPDQSAYWTAWKYDRTLPYLHQTRVELGSFPTQLAAQQACQQDYNSLQPQALIPT
jgi:hypothetical protein